MFLPPLLFILWQRATTIEWTSPSSRSKARSSEPDSRVRPPRQLPSPASTLWSSVRACFTRGVSNVAPIDVGTRLRNQMTERIRPSAMGDQCISIKLLHRKTFAEPDYRSHIAEIRVGLLSFLLSWHERKRLRPEIENSRLEVQQRFF
jgi:hypothetical protein